MSAGSTTSRQSQCPHSRRLRDSPHLPLRSPWQQGQEHLCTWRLANTGVTGEEWNNTHTSRYWPLHTQSRLFSFFFSHPPPAHGLSCETEMDFRAHTWCLPIARFPSRYLHFRKNNLSLIKYVRHNRHSAAGRSNPVMPS